MFFRKSLSVFAVAVLSLATAPVALALSLGGGDTTTGGGIKLIPKSVIEGGTFECFLSDVRSDFGIRALDVDEQGYAPAEDSGPDAGNPRLITGPALIFGSLQDLVSNSNNPGHARVWCKETIPQLSGGPLVYEGLFEIRDNFMGQTGQDTPFLFTTSTVDGVTYNIWSLSFASGGRPRFDMNFYAVDPFGYCSDNSIPLAECGVQTGVAPAGGGTFGQVTDDDGTELLAAKEVLRLTVDLAKAQGLLSFQNCQSGELDVTVEEACRVKIGRTWTDTRGKGKIKAVAPVEFQFQSSCSPSLNAGTTSEAPPNYPAAFVGFGNEFANAPGPFDMNSLKIEGAYLRSDCTGVAGQCIATAFSFGVHRTSSEPNCGVIDAKPDLVLDMDRLGLIDALRVAGKCSSKGDDEEVTISGNLASGEQFSFTETLKITQACD